MTEARKAGFIIGQAPPKSEAERPFGRTKLYKWFAEIGIDDAAMAQHFDYGALVNTFPGSGKSGHLPPSAEAIAHYQPQLVLQIDQVKYKIIIPVGKMAIEHVLARPVELHDVIGKQFQCKAFGKVQSDAVVIPLPHPSGASTWIYKPENAALFKNAMRLISDAM